MATCGKSRQILCFNDVLERCSGWFMRREYWPSIDLHLGAVQKLRIQTSAPQLQEICCPRVPWLIRGVEVGGFGLQHLLTWIVCSPAVLQKVTLGKFRKVFWRFRRLNNSKNTCKAVPQLPLVSFYCFTAGWLSLCLHIGFKLSVNRWRNGVWNP